MEKKIVQTQIYVKCMVFKLYGIQVVANIISAKRGENSYSKSKK